MMETQRVVWIAAYEHYRRKKPDALDWELDAMWMEESCRGQVPDWLLDKAHALLRERHAND